MAARHGTLGFHVGAAIAANGISMPADRSSTSGAFAAIVARGASSTEIAQTAYEVWQLIDASLTPIIGQRGVAALYSRTVHLLRHDRPSLAALDVEATSVDVLGELQRASERETADVAMEMNAAMLETFRELLTKLIGDSLTERLLRPAWDHLASSAAAPGPSQ
jgi:hypothetical protein